MSTPPNPELQKTKMANLKDGDLGATWLDWIIGQSLLNEAIALIGPAALPRVAANLHKLLPISPGHRAKAKAPVAGIAVATGKI
jgi:hypothetical protein